MEEIKDCYQSLCAKTDAYNRDLWLPLWMHLVDTGEVCAYLCSQWLSDNAKHIIRLDDEILLKYCCFLGMLHDLGKATTLFQFQITRKRADIRERLIEEGWCFPDESFIHPGYTKHAQAGERILLKMTKGQYLKSTALIVGAHHGKPGERFKDDNFESYEWNYHTSSNGKDMWTEFWHYWMGYSLKYVGFNDVSELPEVNMRAQMILTGLLIMADWIASNTNYFPLIALDRYPDMTIYPLRTESAFDRLNFPQKIFGGGNTKAKSVSFEHRFGWKPNEGQEAMIRAGLGSEKPGIFILEAQMGTGKTEAALAAAEILMEKFKCAGIFFGLPTQATSDNIFPRIVKWAEQLSESTKHTIRLVHGMAELNEEYKKLTEDTVNIYNEDAGLFDEYEYDDSGLVVHEWFRGRKQALLADFVVGTIDQLLMSVLKQKHVMLRHLGLAGKVVVIDECHAYDAYMNRYLNTALRWLGAYGVPVILLSATLPQLKREEFLRAYTGIQELDFEGERGRKYPLLTWSNGRNKIIETSIDSTRNNNKKIRIIRNVDLSVVESLRCDLKDGGCAGLIFNTVRRAQVFYEELKKKLPEMRIILLHAQMVATDRIARERRINELIGKQSTPKMRDRVVVIGTSVLEQSLDIDFDVLYSELCPMDLLLQRMGRLHRHTGRKRPKDLTEPTAHVLCCDEKMPEDGSKAVYGEYLLMKTRRMLPQYINLPGDIPELVCNIYDYNNDCGLTGDQFEKAKDVYLRKIGIKEQKAGVYLLPDPDLHEEFNRRNSLYGLLNTDVAANDYRAEAAVRDGGHSIDVIVLMKDEEGVCFLPWQNEGRYIPTYRIPSKEECMEVLKQRIRLPHRFCHGGIIDRTIRELEDTYKEYFFEWDDSPWLGRELVLLFDSQLRACLCGYELCYDREQGLIIIPGEEGVR